MHCKRAPAAGGSAGCRCVLWRPGSLRFCIHDLEFVAAALAPCRALLPLLVVQVVNAFVSMGRIAQFLYKPESLPLQVGARAHVLGVCAHA